jgi:hypothetical protein
MNIEKQKVSLVTNVIHEKTVAALQMLGRFETASFVQLILRMWTILNVKNAISHVLLNDPDRRPVTSVDDERLSFLEQMAESFAKMPGGRGPNRRKSLTAETKAAFIQTLNGLCSLTRRLLGEGYTEILLGIFQSDDLEGEFGVYRQLWGGCYFIAVEQVLASASFRRLKLYESILSSCGYVQHTSNTTLNCCTETISDHEMEVLDEIEKTFTSLSLDEEAALYFICGYVTRKLRIDPNNHLSATPLSDESQFTELVSRGKLLHPPDWLFVFSQ